MKPTVSLSYMQSINALIAHIQAALPTVSRHRIRGVIGRLERQKRLTGTPGQRRSTHYELA
jgi:hypothetical protein